jgi:two-component system, OmpR family, response regulator
MSKRKCQSILCVDDDPDICEIVQTTLSLVAGFDVYTAASGEQAIDLAYEFRPDLILMDVMMPGLDGPATLKRIRNSTLINEIPVIFLTAKVLPEELAHFLHLGAIGVIRKPFDPIKLGDELIALWQSKDATREAIDARSGASRVQTKVGSLTEGFLLRTREDAVRLTEMFERICAGDRSILGDVERIAHAIHGTGAMFGFPQLSAAGGAIEEIAGEVIANRSASLSAMDPAVRKLLDCTQRLAREVETAWEAPDNLDANHCLFAGR